METLRGSKKYVQEELDINIVEEYEELGKKGLLPPDIPNTPHVIYNRSGEWEGYGKFLGTGNIAPKDKVNLSLKDAINLLKNFNFKNSREYRKSGKDFFLKNKLPSSPDSYYKNFPGWHLYLGTKRPERLKKGEKYWSHNKCRKFLIKLKLKTNNDFIKYCQSGEKPRFIPARPHKVYSKSDGYITDGYFYGGMKKPQALKLSKLRKLEKN